MKAITVNFIPPAQVKGARYKATDSDRNQVTLSADDALTAEENADACALALCEKMRWLQHDMVTGGLPNGDRVYVFATPGSVVRVPENPSKFTNISFDILTKS
jgi:hypothetical protein